MSVFRDNVAATSNLLESLRKNCPETKILIAGSSREYGAVLPEECPVKENRALKPDSPYAMSKAEQFLIGSRYARDFGMNVYYARIFYLTGPGQPDGFVCSSLIRQAVLLKKNMISKIAVGNLRLKRDFLDVRDAVSALFLITEKGRPGETYNICSGKACSVEEIFRIILKLAGLEGAEFGIEPGLIRESEPPVIFGDNSKIVSETNWRPVFPIEKALGDLLKEYEENAETLVDSTRTEEAGK